MKKVLIVLIFIFLFISSVSTVLGNEITIESPNSENFDSSRVDLVVKVEEKCDLEYVDRAYTLFDFYKEFEIEDLGTGPLDLPVPTSIETFSLCKDCDEYSRKRQFDEGFHRLTVRCSDDPDVSDQGIFSIDNRRPRILRTYPRMNSFTNGDNFKIRYSEDMLLGVSLRIEGILDELQHPPFSFIDDPATCPIGRNQECTFDIDLSDHDGEEIDFEYIVWDYGGREVHSRKTRATVDLTDPVLLNPEGFWEQGEDRLRRMIYFDFEVDEENFEKITYVDLEDRRPRERRLCSRLREGRCIVRRGFSQGDHTLEISIIDKAGNSILEKVEFSV